MAIAFSCSSWACVKGGRLARYWAAMAVASVPRDVFGNLNSGSAALVNCVCVGKSVRALSAQGAPRGPPILSSSYGYVELQYRAGAGALASIDELSEQPLSSEMMSWVRTAAGTR